MCGSDETVHPVFMDSTSKFHGHRIVVTDILRLLLKQKQGMLTPVVGSNCIVQVIGARVLWLTLTLASYNNISVHH